MNQRSFGRKTEQLYEMHQMNLFEVFNEPEIFSDDSKEPEITEITISYYTRKKKTSREQNLEGLPARLINHTLSDDELLALFPDGYKVLPDEIYKRLSLIPQTFIVDEHHVQFYAYKNNVVPSSRQIVLQMFSETVLPRLLWLQQLLPESMQTTFLSIVSQTVIKITVSNW